MNATLLRYRSEAEFRPSSEPFRRASIPTMSSGPRSETADVSPLGVDGVADDLGKKSVAIVAAFAFAHIAILPILG